jgi:hypothetical protein
MPGCAHCVSLEGDHGTLSAFDLNLNVVDVGNRPEASHLKPWLCSHVMVSKPKESPRNSIMELVRLTPAEYHTNDSYWRLFKVADGSVYILVECEASFVGYQFMIKLNAEEMRDYHGLGWLSIQHLANRINYFVSDYSGRRITGSLLEEANQVSAQE